MVSYLLIGSFIFLLMSNCSLSETFDLSEATLLESDVSHLPTFELEDIQHPRIQSLKCYLYPRANNLEKLELRHGDIILRKRGNDADFDFQKILGKRENGPDFDFQKFLGKRGNGVTIRDPWSRITERSERNGAYNDFQKNLEKSRNFWKNYLIVGRPA